MELEKKLKLNVLSRAKIFIEDMRSFGPFGTKSLHVKVKDVVFDIDEDAKLITVDGKEYNVSIEGSTFNSKVLIEILISKFSNEIKKGDCQAAAIAFDVAADFSNSDGVYEKRDALCLRISTDGDEWSEEYFPYMVIDGECVWR